MRIIKESILTNDTHIALNQLVESCRITDGCEPALQMVHSLNCHAEMKSWILAYENEHLVGVLPIFQPMPHEAECAGCVHPDFRERGIFKALSEAAIQEINRYGNPKILWMVNRQSQKGLEFLKHKGLILYQTEYTMKYAHQIHDQLADSKVMWRRAVPEDIADIAIIQASAFSEKKDDATAITTRFIEDETRENYIGYYEDFPVASVSVFVSGTTANINAFAVHAAYQGKGLGKAFISQLIQEYEKLGFEITLEVHSENDRAFSLYKHVGFQITEAIDYYTP